MSDIEEFKPIDGYVEYSISNHGNCKNKYGRLLKGSFDKNGYIRFCLTLNKREKTIKAHRLVYEHFIGDLGETGQVDHIDRCKTNNHWKNLRIATPSQNAWNKSAQVNNSSGYRGVSPGKSGCWRVDIMCNGEKRYARFPSLIDAAEQYNEWAKELFGAFACLNNIDYNEDKFFH